ncbi:MAG: rRNA maturation RNase YbeY [Candidatus Nanopelagicales bacterium]
MSIDISNESGIECDERSLVVQAAYVMGRLRLHPQAELAITLVDEGTMTVLHEQWMNEPGPTDVLSFPMDELRADEGEPQEGHLGDIVVCPQVAQRQAEVAGHSFRDEMGVLVTHGILHLLGYDHAEPDEERLMFGLQGQLVAEFKHEHPELYEPSEPGDSENPENAENSEREATR